MSQEKILAQSRRGMSQLQLERIYGRDLVRSILSPLRPTSPPTPRPFDRRLCDCRVSLKMTILEFARFTGIAEGALTAYEAGRRKPVSPEVIGKLARVMGEPVDQLRADLGLSASVTEPVTTPVTVPVTESVTESVTSPVTDTTVTRATACLVCGDPGDSVMCIKCRAAKRRADALARLMENARLRKAARKGRGS